MNSVQSLQALGKGLLKEDKPYTTPLGLGPFAQSHMYVNDARGNTVCECNDIKIAKAIAKLLNDTYPSKKLKEQKLNETVGGSLGGKAMNFTPSDDSTLGNLEDLRDGEVGENRVVKLSAGMTGKPTDYIAVRTKKDIELQGSNSSKVFGRIPLDF